MKCDKYFHGANVLVHEWKKKCMDIQTASGETLELISLIATELREAAMHDVPETPDNVMTASQIKTYTVINQTEDYFIFKDEDGKLLVKERQDCIVHAISVLR